jgi:hypothetical protein
MPEEAMTEDTEDFWSLSLNILVLSKVPSRIGGGEILFFYPEIKR